MKLLFALLVLAIGAFLPAQAGMNAEFRRHVGHPLLASVLNMCVGAAAVIAVAVLLRVPLPSRSDLAAAPWWAYAGGLIGAAMVTVALMAAPRLGAALLVALLVAGQLAAGCAIDHFGLIGYPRHPISTTRVVGIAVLFAGVLLIERG